MSSKASSKKKSSVGTPDPTPTPTKKIKIPKSFIVRPSNDDQPKQFSTVFIHPEIFTAMEFTPGQFVYVSRSDGGLAGFVALVAAGVDILDKNVITISGSYRKLAGLLLGDRVEIVTYLNQPEYAKEVSVYVDEGEENSEDELKKSLNKLLDDIGLIYPGLRFLIPKQDREMTIIDVENTASLEASLSKLSINEAAASSPSDIISPVYLFAKGKSSITILTTPTTPSKSKYPNLPQPIQYSHIGGLSKQISLLKSTIELPLHNPTLFSSFGISPPRGILLHGPPGTGKSILLRSVANETPNVHVLTINGPAIVSKYLGETENTIRDIFMEARKYQPSIIFMDELDSIAPPRQAEDTSGGETEARIVAQLLTMMDGLGDSARVIIIGATNRPNSIDVGLRRPGRFDQEIEIGIPDIASRGDILQKLVNKMQMGKYELDQGDIGLIASKTHGYVGADLTALCREAVMQAIKRGLATGEGEIKMKVEDLISAMSEIRPSAMREIFLEMPKVYWTDIGGQEELKKKLIEVVQLPLEAAGSFKRLGVSAPKGVLLYGPPGCSKTLTAKALATESGLNFLAVKGPEIFNKYVGESERTIREIFRKARAASPSIIFFDEIDAISGDRDSANTQTSQTVLTSLLNEIDGVEELKGVVIVGATNKPTEIDPRNNSGPSNLSFNVDSNEVDFEQLAELTQGCSGAEVTLLCQEAGLAAVMEDKEANKVEKKHFDHALKGISKGITEDMLDYYKSFSNRSGLNV
ncbi:AFG2 [[Candida] subhashii]|uniref:AFG2 n=1 Tax=[Candida] subhashii TaxID=561895 RepID=A0A8J5QF78_9ASCO|nr:AFG2 [[Candida] subhashii]KAG7660969.1 AFG2 [[Candida] subhashii]